MARNVQVNLVRLLKLLRHLIRQLADDFNAARMEAGGDRVHILLPLVMGDIVQFIVVKTSTDTAAQRTRTTTRTIGKEASKGEAPSEAGNMRQPLGSGGAARPSSPKSSPYRLLSTDVQDTKRYSLKLSAKPEETVAAGHSWWYAPPACRC